MTEEEQESSESLDWLPVFQEIKTLLFFITELTLSI